MSDGFYKTVEKILVTLMIGSAAALGIGVGVREGTDPLREEFVKFREMVTGAFEKYNWRLDGLERCQSPAERLCLEEPRR